MDAVSDGTFHTKHMVGTDIDAECADAALLAVFSAAASITFITFGAMQSHTDGTIGAEGGSFLHGTIITNRDAIPTRLALFAPIPYFEITAVAFGTMGPFFDGTFHTDVILSQTDAAIIANLRT